MRIKDQKHAFALIRDEYVSEKKRGTTVTIAHLPKSCEPEDISDHLKDGMTLTTEEWLTVTAHLEMNRGRIDRVAAAQKSLQKCEWQLLAMEPKVRERQVERLVACLIRLQSTVLPQELGLSQAICIPPVPRQAATALPEAGAPACLAPSSVVDSRPAVAARPEASHTNQVSSGGMSSEASAACPARFNGGTRFRSPTYLTGLRIGQWCAAHVLDASAWARRCTGRTLAGLRQWARAARAESPFRAD